MSKEVKLTKRALIEDLARVLEISLKDAQAVLDVIPDSTVRALREGERVEVRGFGIFRTRQRRGRVGRNPKTGVEVQVPAKRIPFFNPGKVLPALLDGAGRDDR